MEETLARKIASELDGQLVGGWKVRGLIDNGNTAVILEAEARGSLAAVKVFDPGLVREVGEAEVRARLDRQISTKGKSHPNIVTTFDGGYCKSSRYYYLAMELVPGATLSSMREEFPRELVGVVLRQLVSAAQFLEELGYVHRDIKPDNIKLNEKDRYVKLLDLGVIKSFYSRATSESFGSRDQFLGTRRYAPPELLDSDPEGEDAWRAVSIYQIGAVLFELIERRVLFSEFPRLAALMRAIHGVVPQVSSEDVPASLTELVNACLKKDPDERLRALSWSKMKDVADALESPPRLEVLPRRTRSKRPVIVFLYAGGTIGAQIEIEGGRRRLVCKPILSRHSARLRRIHRHLIPRIAQFHDSRVAERFEILWEILPPDSQMFSENATARLWNSVYSKVNDLMYKYTIGSLGMAEEEVLKNVHMVRLYREELAECEKEAGVRLPTKAEFYEAISGRYLAGIVVLHGTDTLSYLAGALALSMDHAICPIVVTGANRPFDEESFSEQDRVFARSDAWSNLVKSVHFVRSIGHRLTDVFVCFGDTVHHGLNLRKVPADELVLPSSAARPGGDERFAFQTYLQGCRYMFRHIDGSFCNNYYSRFSRHDFVSLSSPEHHEWRHLRVHAEESGLSEQTWGAPPFTEFGIAYLKVAPCMQPIWIPAGNRGRRSLKILLLEGYRSATYATVDEHGCSAILERAERMGIPIVLISRNGLHPDLAEYGAQKIRGRWIRVLRLYGIIVETALPLLAYVFRSIEPRTWAMDKVPPKDRYEARLDLMKHRISRFFLEKKRLFLHEMGDVTDREAQRHRMLRLDGSDRSRWARISRINDERIDVRLGDRDLTDRFNQRRLEQIVTLARAELLWSLEHEVQPSEIKGAGPDAFAMLFERGFAFGDRVYRQLSGRTPPDWDRVFLDSDDQESRVRKARDLAERQMKIIQQNGISDLALIGLDAKSDGRFGRLKLEARSRKHDLRFVRSDELYAVKGITDDEEKFFDWVEARRESVATASSRIEMRRKLSVLDEGTWKRKSGALDWYIAGYLKASVCGLARYLHFDPWIERCRDSWGRPEYVWALRRTIAMRFEQSDEHFLRLSLRYSSEREGA